jgi:hypothetical protein
VCLSIHPSILPSFRIRHQPNCAVQSVSYLLFRRPLSKKLVLVKNIRGFPQSLWENTVRNVFGGALSLMTDRSLRFHYKVTIRMLFPTYRGNQNRRTEDLVGQVHTLSNPLSSVISFDPFSTVVMVKLDVQLD